MCIARRTYSDVDKIIKFLLAEALPDEMASEIELHYRERRRRRGGGGIERRGEIISRRFIGRSVHRARTITGLAMRKTPSVRKFLNRVYNRARGNTRISSGVIISFLITPRAAFRAQLFRPKRRKTELLLHKKGSRAMTKQFLHDGGRGRVFFS